MRTAIYGAGSLGTILGAFISKAGKPVELINRNKAHVEALNTNGAKVTGTMEFTRRSQHIHLTRCPDNTTSSS